MFVDVHSVAGQVILTWLEAQIEQKRRSMEKPLHDHAETQYLRGQLKTLRLLQEVMKAPGTPQAAEEVNTFLQEYRRKLGVDTKDEAV